MFTPKITSKSLLPKFSSVKTIQKPEFQRHLIEAAKQLDYYAMLDTFVAWVHCFDDTQSISELVGYQDSEGYTALMYVVDQHDQLSTQWINHLGKIYFKSKQLACLFLLLEYMTVELVNLKNKSKETALFLSLFYNELLCVHLLNNGAEPDLACGISINDSKNKTDLCLTPAMIAAQNNSLLALRYLVYFGADLRAVDADGHNVLFHAAVRGAVHCLFYLLVSCELSKELIPLDYNEQTIIECLDDDMRDLEASDSLGPDEIEWKNKVEFCKSLIHSAMKYNKLEFDQRGSGSGTATACLDVSSVSSGAEDSVDTDVGLGV